MEKQHNEYILKALKIANDLIGLANNEEVLGNDNVCGILLGVMRDCAYKIRRQVEREHQARKAKSQWRPCVSEIQQERRFNLKKSIMILGAVLILCAAVARPVNASIILSTNATETLGGLSFYDGDIAEYDPATDTATLFFDESLFSADEDIDAVHILESGSIVLSTCGAATLGGLSFADGDLIEYNPTTYSATLYFAEDLFSSNANIDAVHMPEPATIAMLGLGCLVLVCQRHK